jgi:peptidoglycan/xylan/chitin deacetylase (PgdA/CDA1 family)
VTQRIPILLYHAVSDRPAPRQAKFTVKPRVFAEHLRAIVDSGRTPMTIAALARARREDALPERPVVVTFDDGFASVRPAVEMLLADGLAATVFVTSGLLGRARMLARADVRELARHGAAVEVGAHSVTHPRLDELALARAQREIVLSKRDVEDLIDADVRSFAYPHGAYDKRVRRAVCSAGFHAAAAVKNAFSHAHDDPYALARVTVTAATGAMEVQALLDGAGAPLAWKHERLRTRAYRSLRRARRRLSRPVA